MTKAHFNQHYKRYRLVAILLATTWTTFDIFAADFSNTKLINNARLEKHCQVTESDNKSALVSAQGEGEWR